MVNGWAKPFSVKTNSGQMHLSAAGHVVATVLAYLACSAHLAAVIFNWKGLQTVKERRKFGGFAVYLGKVKSWWSSGNVLPLHFIGPGSNPLNEKSCKIETITTSIYNRKPEKKNLVPNCGTRWAATRQRDGVGCLLFQASRACVHAHMIFTTVSKRDTLS